MKIAEIPWRVGLAGLLALGCDDPQYVNPDTVALIVTNDSTGVERVNRCHFVPVLLGSQDKARYLVEDQIRATLTLTRDSVSVSFEDAGVEIANVAVDSRELAGETRVPIDDGPAGFSAELVSPCVPESF